MSNYTGEPIEYVTRASLEAEQVKREVLESQLATAKEDAAVNRRRWYMAMEAEGRWRRKAEKLIAENERLRQSVKNPDAVQLTPKAGAP